MATRHVIVDGSNLATEGRNMPSLEQLDRAVREFIAENPRDEVTVVVDASFGHRIDPSEVAAFEAAEAAGEVISPPAGAIGRGDAFLLRIAEKMGATVLSNDSFQEFHAEHTWLFEKGRLVGGKPVPGVGWIFMDRTPVRGAKSREVIKEAKRRKRTGDDVAGEAKAADKPVKARPKAVDRAIARATQEVVEPKGGPKARRRRTASPPSEPVNEPLAFITFIAAHPLGSHVVGTVVEYSSHGAFIDADGARCYIPLSAMGDPPPRKAREVVTKGEEAGYVVQAFDPLRRGIELALPAFAHPAGSPTAETVEAEIHRAEEVAEEEPRRAPGRRRAATTAPEPQPAPSPGTAAEAERPARRRRAAGPEVPSLPAEPEEGGSGIDREESAPPTRRAGAGRTRPAVAGGGAPALEPAGAAKTPPKRATARKAPRAGLAPPVPGQEMEAAAVEEAAPAKKAPARKAPARKAPAAKAPAARKAAPRKAAAAPADGLAAEEAPVGRAAAKKAPARRAAAAVEPSGEPVPAKKAPAKKAPAKRAPARKAPAASVEAASAESPAKKAPAKKAPARNAPAKQAAARKAAPARGTPTALSASAGDAPPSPATKRSARGTRTAGAGPADPAGVDADSGGAARPAQQPAGRAVGGIRRSRPPGPRA